MHKFHENKKIKIEFLLLNYKTNIGVNSVICGNSENNFAVLSEGSLILKTEKNPQEIPLKSSTEEEIESYLKIWNFNSFYLTITPELEVLRVYIKNEKPVLLKLKSKIKIPKDEHLKNFSSITDSNDNTMAIIYYTHHSIFIKEKVKNIQFQCLKKNLNEIGRVYNLKNQEIALTEVDEEYSFSIKFLKIGPRNLKILATNHLCLKWDYSYELISIKQNKTGDIYFLLLSKIDYDDESFAEYYLQVLVKKNREFFPQTEILLRDFENIECFDVISEDDSKITLIYFGIYKEYRNFVAAIYDKILQTHFVSYCPQYQTPIFGLTEFIKFTNYGLGDEVEDEDSNNFLYGTDIYRTVIKLSLVNN